MTVVRTREWIEATFGRFAWRDDPENPETVSSEVGGHNSLLVVN